MRTVKKCSGGYRGAAGSVAGFTLIEMAISVAIVGMMLAAAVEPYSLWLKSTAMTTTNANVAGIVSAIGSFRSINGYYPCPAPMNVPRNNPNYGHQMLSLTAAQPAPPAPPLTECETRGTAFGTCAGGICIQQQPAAIPDNSVTYNPGGGLPPVTEHPLVAIGSIPFRDLSLDESQAIDGYNNRIFYAVTERLADPVYFQPNGGGIEIHNDQGASALPTVGSAHFIVFSAGRDGVGAFSLEGTLVQPCPPAGPEAENCDMAPLAVYQAAQTKTVAGPAYFDDVVSYFTNADMPYWQSSTADPNSIVEKPGGDVGTFTSAQATLSYKTQAADVLHVSGNLMINQLCNMSGVNPAGTNCFSPSQFAGTLSAADRITGTAASKSVNGMACPAGQYMDYIQQAQPHCVAEVFAQCGTDASGQQQIMQGLNVLGKPICVDYTAPPLPCVARTATLCVAGDVSLPADPIGTSLTETAGDSRSDSFTCIVNGPGVHGVWLKGANPTGACTCTPGTKTTGPFNCPKGYGGTYTCTTTTTCAPKNSTTVCTKAAGCTCTGGSQTQTAYCSVVDPGTHGHWTQTRTLDCATGNWSPYLPAAPPPGTCTCTPQPDNHQTVQCPGGLDGSWKQTQSWDCGLMPPGWDNWTPATPPAGACTCNAGKKDDKHDDCPSGQIGSGIDSERTLSCPTGTGDPGQWSDWVVISTDCQPAPPQVCHVQAPNGTGQPSSTGFTPTGSTCDCSVGSVANCSTELGRVISRSGTAAIASRKRQVRPTGESMNVRKIYSAGIARECGFTLVELAITTVISGIATLIIFAALDYQTLTNQRATTLANVADIQNAMFEYKGNVGHFPCPADPTLPPTDPNYGVANCALPAPFVTTSNRDADGDGNLNDQILVGAVPYVTLQGSIYYTRLPGSEIVDGWNRKFVYAVTQNMTTTPFDDSHGAIGIHDENNISLVQPPDSAEYVLISYGPNGRGAYSQTGALAQPCGTTVYATPPPNPPVGTLPPNDTEIENCDYGAPGANGPEFLAALSNTSYWNYNDDIVKFLTAQRKQLWSVTGTTCVLNTNVVPLPSCGAGPADCNCLKDASGNDVMIPLASNSNSGNVGVGVDPPSQKLTVLGPVSASWVFTSKLCDQGCSPGSLLDPQLIGGGTGVPGSGGLVCPAGQVIWGIENGQADCVPAPSPASAGVSCPAGQFAIGVSNIGHIKCWDPATGKTSIH